MKISLKRYSTCLFSILLVNIVINFNAYGQTLPDSSRIVRILSYNILHGATLNNDFDLELISRVIKSASPDLVALQEVDYRTNRAKKMDIVLELGNLTGMAPLFGKAMPYDDGEYGEGILSQYSFNHTKNHVLPYSENHEPRAALAVNITLADGSDIVFVGTHLDHTRNPQDRISQASKINDLFGNFTVPTILAGDLNARPESEPINILKEKWEIAGGNDPEPTFPSSDPQSKIDYVMFRPADRWRVLEVKVIDEKTASDHCPLLVVLELLPKKK
ncbi:MAG: hypothetical protein GY863_01325 [bacterium]|nr:hypothetical protein [bacterium]